MTIVDWEVGFSLRGEGEAYFYDYVVRVKVPPEHLDAVRRGFDQTRESAVIEAFKDAISAESGPVESARSLNILIESAPASVYSGWRDTLHAQVVGDAQPMNQGTLGKYSSPHEWHGLRFRSKSEIAIAKELHEREILYFPLPAAVRGSSKFEPDFLVCADGIWAVLEVHGEPFHPPERRTQEDERARWFKYGGVSTVESYDSLRCFQDPRSVVDEFLELVRKIRH